MSKLKLFWQESWLLLVSAFFFGLLLAITEAAWRPRIERNEQAELNRVMAGLLAEAQTFEVVGKTTIELGRGKQASCEIFKGLSSSNECIGYCFAAEAAGFADKIKMLIAVDKDFAKIEGLDFLDMKETPGFGENAKQPYFRDQFAGAPAGKLDLSKTGDEKNIDSEIVALTGATVTSTAVVDGVNVYTEQVKKMLIEKGLIQHVK